MNPQPRKPAKPRASKQTPRDTEATETQPAAAESAAPVDASATPTGAAAIKPPPAFPLHVALETGLSDYGMWYALLANVEHPPLPAGARRGRIWG